MHLSFFNGLRGYDSKYSLTSIPNIIKITPQLGYEVDCLKIVHSLIQNTPQLDPRPTALLFVQILLDLMLLNTKKLQIQE